MKILFDNREYIFDNVEQKNNMITIKSNFSFCSILNNYKLEYDEFMSLFESSLCSYVDIPSEADIMSFFEEYFNYFKITTNPLVKKNMATKITYLLINNFTDQNIQNKVCKMVNDFKPPIKDRSHIFLKVMLRLKSIKLIIEKDSIFDEEYFTYLDFILDYNLE